MGGLIQSRGNKSKEMHRKKNGVLVKDESSSDSEDSHSSMGVGEDCEEVVALKSFGEAFMASFDDVDDSEEEKEKEKEDKAGDEASVKQSKRKRKRKKISCEIKGTEEEEEEEEGRSMDEVDEIFEGGNPKRAKGGVDSNGKEGGEEEKREKEVVVVTFQDPKSFADKNKKSVSRKELDLFMSSKIGNVHSTPKAKVDSFRRKKKGGNSNSKIESGNVGNVEISSFAKDVESLGAIGLTGRARKEFEIRKLKELGASGPKNQKVPYHILKGMKRKEEERYQKQREKAKEMGLMKGEKLKPFKTTSLIYGNKEPKKKVEVRGIKETAMGKFRGGTLFLDKKTIANVRSSGKKKGGK
eukprot:Nk52_evm1s2084 gene=Nk52_evmTU1s2084